MLRLRSHLMPLAVLAATAAIQPLPAPLKTQLKGGYWHAGCPVQLGQLRLLTVKTWGFDGKPHTGQLVVNEKAAAPLATVFTKLYALRFPIRHMQLSDAYVRERLDPGHRHHRVIRVPAGVGLALHRQDEHRHVVEPRLRARGRHQPEREPLHRLRDDARPEAAHLHAPRERCGPGW